MNIQSIRQSLWNPKPKPRTVHEQLELPFLESRLSRTDLQILTGLRNLRAELAKN